MKIKQIPEDFIVRERIKLDFSNGKYSYFKLNKKRWNTLDAVKEIANRLGMGIDRFGFAGNKDRQAVSEQAISIYDISKERIDGIKIKDIELKYLGSGNKRINLGDLEGNDFIVTVRDLKKKVKVKKIKIKNFYDEQRFGINENNHLVGKAIVKKDFKMTCQLLSIEVEGNNYLNALRNTSKRMLRFYIHAYQSYLFNEVLKKVSNSKKLPVPGFLTKFRDKRLEKKYSDILKKEGVALRDFIIAPYKEISSEGGDRDAFVTLTKLKVRWDKDELNKGKWKAIASFSLGKGQYATAVVKALFGKGI